MTRPLLLLDGSFTPGAARRLWSAEDHERCDRKLRAAPRDDDEAPRRAHRRCRPKLTAERRALVDAIVRARWESAPTIEAIAVEAGHTAPFISKRARELGLPPRREDRRRP